MGAIFIDNNSNESDDLCHTLRNLIDHTALYFSYAQLANLIKQLIELYPTNTITVFLTGFNPSSVTGTPYQLYLSSGGTYGGLFILNDGGQYQAVPLDAITAIDMGSDAVYNTNIKYLTSTCFTRGYDANIITAIHDYLSTLTDVEIYMGSIVYGTGTVLKNEYGIIVLSDTDGNAPAFIPVNNITLIIPPNQQNSLKKASTPHISATNNP